MVRNTLGEDAIIVATREENGGRSVRVTAAIEQFDTDPDLTDMARAAERNSPSAHTQTEEDWLQYDSESDKDMEMTDRMTEALLAQGVPDDVLESLVSTAMMTGQPVMEDALAAAIDHLYGFVPLPRKSSRKAIMLVGAPGAGKTLAAAKLAARASMEGMNVAAITTDTIRAGGVEQLESFTKLLQAPLLKAKDAGELKTALAHSKNADQIIIDTAGVNPFDLDDMTALARLIESGSIDPVLVLPSGLDGDDSGEIARSFAVLGVQKLLSSRLDISKRLGGLLAAAGHGGLSFTDASNTAKVVSGLVALSPLRLARQLLPRPESGPDLQNMNNNAGDNPVDKNGVEKAPRAMKRRVS